MIVDNDPDASARAFASTLKSTSFCISYLHEARPGKSYASNAAVRHSSGAILLFTDDDVRVPSRWVEGMATPILRDEADAVLGGIRLADELLRPWMSPRHRSILASTERLNPASPGTLVGANMAISRKVFESVPAFDVDLGPGALGFGEDTLLACQALAAGFRIVSAFDTFVVHHFPADRLSRKALLDYARRKGRSNAYIDYHWRHASFPAPQLRAIGLLIKLAIWKLLHLSFLSTDEGLPEAEFLLHRRYHELRYHRTLMGKRRHYDRFGLTRLDNVPSANPVA